MELLKLKKYQEVEKLFKNLGEVKELRLGFANNSFSGSGAGLKKSDDIIKSLIKSQSLNTLLYEDIEDLALFVPGVGKDVMSDIVASLIKNQLASYTKEQCKIFDIPMVKNQDIGYHWCSKSVSWKKELVPLPIDDDDIPILLVPKRIVSFSQKYVHQELIQHYIVNFQQNEYEKLHYKKISKEVIKKDIKTPYKKYACEFIIDKNFLMKEFKRRTILKMDPLDDLKLIFKFSEANKASNHDLEAINNIQNLLTNQKLTYTVLTRIIEFLYYPSISIPTLKTLKLTGKTFTYLQFEISDGYSFMKRDIKYDNYYLVENSKQIYWIRKHISDANHTYIVDEEFGLEIEPKKERMLNLELLKKEFEKLSRNIYK